MRSIYIIAALLPKEYHFLKERNYAELGNLPANGQNVHQKYSYGCAALSI